MQVKMQLILVRLKVHVHVQVHAFNDLTFFWLEKTPALRKTPRLFEVLLRELGYTKGKLNDILL